MGLKSKGFISRVIVLSTFLMSACAGLPKNDVGLADRDAHNQTWYFDCCNPALSAGTKELCKDAAVDEDHILHDMDGNKYVFVWSECEIGKERWREWE